MYSPADIDKTIPGSASETAALGRIDKYELVRELGEGGFGAVYLARDTVAGIDVAIKGLPPEVKHNESELESIRANFALVSRLRHPNIVGLRDLHRAERVSYTSKEVEEKLRVFERDTMVVMDYAPGATLAKWRRQFPDAKVPLDKAIEIARQIASALDAAHAQKVLHRDVKPENVMVETREDGALVARVLDFGLAAEIRSSMGRVSRKILDTSGTRPYMAPEQWLGEEQNAATDQYALAVLFYELVTGKTPFSSVFDCGDTAVMRLAVTTDAPKIPASLPKAVRRALDTALAKTPDERFATCGDFVVALEGKSISRRGAETQRKSGAVKMLGLLALLAVLAVGVWRFVGRETTSVAPSPASAELTPPVASGDISNVPPSSDPSPVTVVDPPKPVVVVPPADDGAESAQKRDAEFVLLKTRINIKKSDAKRKMEAVAEFRADPEGLVERIASADSQWKTISALSVPGTLEEAQAAFDMADKAESQIALALDWLQKNKTGRDAAKSARAEIAALLKGDAVTFKAEKYASSAYRDGKRLRDEGEAAFGKGDFAGAGRLMKLAHAKFVDAAKDAKAFFVKTTLGSAREYFSASQWQSCIAECDTLLGWDAANVEARRLKAQAEECKEAARKEAERKAKEVAAKIEEESKAKEELALKEAAEAAQIAAGRKNAAEKPATERMANTESGSKVEEGVALHNRRFSCEIVSGLIERKNSSNAICYYGNVKVRCSCFLSDSEFAMAMRDGNDEIASILLCGDVRINGDVMSATAESARFDVSLRKLTLLGKSASEPARLHSGDVAKKGERIVYEFK